MDGHYFDVVARLTNNCSRAVGVGVKMVVYDKNKDIVTVKDFWPASTQNIPAHSDYPFEESGTVDDWNSFQDPGALTFSLRVIELRVWQP